VRWRGAESARSPRGSLNRYFFSLWSTAPLLGNSSFVYLSSHPVIQTESGMNIYDIAMMPLEAWLLKKMRSEIMPSAYGDVLEVGIGTGVNLQHYNFAKIRSLTGLDRQSSSDLERRAGKNFSFYQGDVEKMPFAEGQFDAVVATLLFCTANIEKGMGEILRVLKPGGLFIFIEHVRPKGARTGKVIDFANSAWTRIADGCNLNRRTDEVLRHSGFSDLTIRESGVFRYGTAKKP